MLGIHTPLTQISIGRPLAADRVALQRVWSASQDRDEPAGRPRDGWWSISNWATASRILTRDDDVIGFAAIEYQPGADAAEARLGLLPEHRRPALAERLIRTAVDLARQAGAPLLRLYTPEQATWAIAPARVWGFRPSRTQHLMVRVADYERGARSVVLWVDGNNTAAFQLYRSAGFTPISTVVISERLVTTGR